MEQYYYAAGAFAGGLLLGLAVSLLRGGKPAARIEAPKPEPPPKAKKPTAEPLRLLALLQAESRIVDFLLEDVSAYSDAQIGQAVRDIHAKAAAALKQHAVIVPILDGAEGANVTVPKGFDPSAIRVLGNVTGEAPYQGEVQHPGWRVKELKLAPPAAGADEFVLQPAEVQVP